jgi:glycosyltransferase involved in cell wall biosynthesis
VKVLLPAFQCNPGRGSEMGIAWYWASALADLGHEVTVLTGTQFRERILEMGQDRVKFHYVDHPASRLTGRLAALDNYDVYRRWQDAAYEYLKDRPERYDLIHHFNWGSLHLGNSTWRLPAPLVYGPIGGGQTAPAHYRSYFGPDWKVERLRTAASGSLLRLHRRTGLTLRHAEVVLVTNSDTGAAARRLGATDVRYMLAEGLPDEWVTQARQKPTGEPVVLWVGRMLARKAPQLAVEAFAELRQQVPARLVMAGDGPMRPEVEKAVARLDLAADVDLLGQIPWDEVRKLYDSASVLLFSSLRDSSGMQFLEALGRGLPAVAIDHHGIGDLEVGPAAVKVPLAASPADMPRDLGTALQTVLTDDLWPERSAAGVAWAKGHVWSAKAAAADKVYRDVVARSS